MVQEKTQFAGIDPQGSVSFSEDLDQDDTPSVVSGNEGGPSMNSQDVVSVESSVLS